MKELIESIKPLVQEELNRANEKFPQFHSAHEGYSVMLEEVEEAKEESNALSTLLAMLWNDIKHNESTLFLEDAKAVKKTATNLAAEAMQTAAMAQKFIDMLESEEK